MIQAKLYKSTFLFEQDENKAELEMNYINNTYEILRKCVHSDEFIQEIKNFAETIIFANIQSKNINSMENLIKLIS